jgi:hypothetical protein
MLRAFIEIFGALFAYAPVSEGEQHRRNRLRALLVLAGLAVVLLAVAMAR